MNPHNSPNNDPKLILRGHNVEIDPSFNEMIHAKAERLFRHEPGIIRLRIDVERDLGRGGLFTAKGLMELAGPDRTATVATHSAHKSVNLLVDKLDRMLRRRSTNDLRRRTSDDIRAHAEPVAVA